MENKKRNPRSRLQFIASVILLAGLAGSLIIYFSAASDEDATQGLENSKMYLYDLERYGGKANVIAYEFTHWFSNLWEGRSLAYTVAIISIALSAGLFFVARHLPHDLHTRGS